MEILPKLFFAKDFYINNKGYYANLDKYIVSIGDLIIHILRYYGKVMTPKFKELITNMTKACLIEMKNQNESFIFNRYGAPPGFSNEDKTILEHMYYSLIGIGAQLHESYLLNAKKDLPKEPIREILLQILV